MVLDLLEQIESVNEMTSLHSDDEFMQKQYKYRRSEFVKELAKYLSECKIQPGVFSCITQIGRHLTQAT